MSSSITTAAKERIEVLKLATELAAYNHFPEKQFTELLETCQKKITEYGDNTSEKEEWEGLLKKLNYIKTNSIEVNVDISEHPPLESIVPIVPGVQLAIGDIHGNSMLLLYFLIKQGILSLKKGPQDYQKLNEIYQKENLTQGDLEKFDFILKHASIHPGATVRFIGDEFADRGNNDYFTLKILKKLKDNKVPVEHLFSNHGAAFLSFYEQGCGSHFKSQIVDPSQTPSLQNLSSLVKRDMISSKELKKLIQENFLSNLKLVSYTVDEDNNCLTLFTHAPVGLTTIQTLAKDLGVTYQDLSAKKLTETLDQMNLRFQDMASKKLIINFLLEEAHSIWERWDQDTGEKEEFTTCLASYQEPFNRVIWNRYKSDIYKELIKQQSKKLQFELLTVHGHDNNGKVPDACRKKTKNLDGKLGKGNNHNKGRYRIHCNFQTSSAFTLKPILKTTEVIEHKETKEPKSPKEQKEILQDIQQTLEPEDLDQDVAQTQAKAFTIALPEKKAEIKQAESETKHSPGGA